MKKNRSAEVMDFFYMSQLLCLLAALKNVHLVGAGLQTSKRELQEPFPDIGQGGFDPPRTHKRSSDLKQVLWVALQFRLPKIQQATTLKCSSENLLLTIKTPMEAWKALNSISLCAVSLYLSTEP